MAKKVPTTFYRGVLLALGILHRNGEQVNHDAVVKEVNTYDLIKAAAKSGQLDSSGLTEWMEREDPNGDRFNANTLSDVHYSSKSDEYNTPMWVLERALTVLGKIDLDPCADVLNPLRVPAERYHTIEDDGLRQPWMGKLWLNPPYGRKIKAWIDRLAQEYEAGNVKEAIALVPARTDTKWWATVNQYPVLLVRGRLHFNDGEGSAPFPSALVYFGKYWWVFEGAFKDKGQLYMPTKFAEKEMG